MDAWQPMSPRWPGLRRGRALVFPLQDAPFAGLAARCAVEGLVLERKREFHVTLLATADTARLACALAALSTRAATQWRREVLALDWRWRCTGERWLIARRGGGKPVALSIVALLQQPAQAAFRERAAALIGTPLPPPVPHVTLYTHGDAGGIGLPDAATFRARRVRPVTEPM